MRARLSRKVFGVLPEKWGSERLTLTHRDRSYAEASRYTRHLRLY